MDKVEPIQWVPLHAEAGVASMDGTRHFSNGESVRELGEKIKAFAWTRKATVQ